MKVDDKIISELFTDDGHMGEVRYANTVNTLARREGTIHFLKKAMAENIIHIGCCGHVHNIDKQMSNHSHFHTMLIESFRKVLGFDINKGAVERIRSYGINDVYANDFVKDTEFVNKVIAEAFGDEPYTILLPEVLEHISNPVSFLSEIVQQHKGHANQIVISVPNAYGFGRVRDALFRNKENINMDHKYMFTPTTLLKVMCMAGIEPQEIDFLDLYKYSKMFKKPMLGNTIIAIGVIKK